MKLNKKKNFKHNPMCFDEILSAISSGNTLEIKYKNKQNSILFNLDENNRSFSFCENINSHIKLINEKLNCEKNKILIWIDILTKIMDKKVKLSDTNILDIQIYDIDEIIKVKKHKNICEYYINICPIYAFILKNKKIYIANQYMFKVEKNKLNMFYTKYDKIKRLLHRPHLKEFIDKFNNSNKSINAKNVMFVINNMQPIYTDCTIDDGEYIYKHELKNIDSNVEITRVKKSDLNIVDDNDYFNKIFK